MPYFFVVLPQLVFQPLLAEFETLPFKACAVVVNHARGVQGKKDSSCDAFFLLKYKYISVVVIDGIITHNKKPGIVEIKFITKPKSGIE